ncbi:MAG: YihY/virulence factor BrkB family protein [Flavobacteriaceae bacterium]|nr:YihY/virulence factor BrkB family protein [Flavobacteriaceae bacterium]
MGFQEKLENLRIIRRIKVFLKSVKIPTLEGLNLYTMLRIYLSGLVRGAITTRAAAISWSLFLSLFPFLLFVYSWIPFLPNFDKIEQTLYTYLVDRIFPQNEADQIENYVSVIARRSGNSWFTILLAIVFATNGVNSLMTGFGNTTRRIAGVKEHNMLKQYFIAFIFTVAVTGFLLTFLWFINYMLNPGTEFLTAWIENTTITNWIKFGMFTVAAFMFFLTAVSFLYFYGIKFDGRFRKMIPGAVLTTFLFFVLAIGFSFYIENFNNYNLLYGSISTLLIVMIFLYAVVVIILLGFELNMTLLYAKDRKEVLLKLLQEEDLEGSGEVLEEEL